MADDWQTPDDIIENARLLFGGSIDLDAASSVAANERIGANRIFTIEDSALDKPAWRAYSLWLNPPYSIGSMNPFTEMFLGQRENFKQGLMLVNVDTSAKWFRLLQAELPHIYFKYRIAFIDPVTGRAVSGNRYQQAIFYHGNRMYDFADCFGDYGHFFRAASEQLLEVNHV
jgi:phage N-6-adenine-methyltransferase